MIHLNLRASIAASFATWLLAVSAFGQQAGQIQQRGTVKSVAGNHSSFVMTDRRTNADISISVNANTKYQLSGRDGAEFIDAVVVGDRVTVNADANSVAIEVRNKNRLGRLPVAQVKQMLDLTDEECAVVVPAINRVLAAGRLLSQAYRNGNGDNQSPDAPEVLKRALRSDQATPTDIHGLVAAVRDQRTKLQGELNRARQELISLLTVRQEATLVQMEVIE